MTLHEWTRFFALCGKFQKLPIRTIEACDVRFESMANTFISVALYEDVLTTVPNEIGLDAAHEMRLAVRA